MGATFVKDARRAVQRVRAASMLGFFAGRFTHVFVAGALAGDHISAAQPASEIGIGAALRAKWFERLVGLAPANRALSGADFLSLADHGIHSIT